jgi:hypothetical protein
MLFVDPPKLVDPNPPGVELKPGVGEPKPPADPKPPVGGEPNAEGSLENALVEP